MPVEIDELRLVWPPALFTAEARALLNDPGLRRLLGGQLEWLLEEAFSGGRAAQLFRERDTDWQQHDSLDAWLSDPPEPRPRPALALVADLADRAEQLPRYAPPVYYSQRRRPAPATPPTPLDLEQLKSGVVQVLAGLERSGYFDEAFGSSCCDSDDDPAATGQADLAAALKTGARLLWPPAALTAEVTAAWPDELFYDLLEALHDRVARPRSRYRHDYGDEWDYADFARRPGQAVYRWRVNELLDRSTVNLRLAETGPDTGRLVETPGDVRGELLDRAVQITDEVARDPVQHAIALFRARSATREDKRSACIALAGILEQRRDLLKQELLSRDEGALFQIANQFDVRHRRADQRGDYDEAYLDWLFWWYLATVELTDRLLERR